MTPLQTEKRPKISLCMMVKNEEILLPRCLDSAKNCVDEIVVVDTGSTDGTVEIAKSYGAKVYHHPWENNFSKHRNQSLSYASGDWILILDADEELAPAQGDRVRETVSQCDEDCTKIYFMVHDIDKEKVTMVSSSLRLFRNHIGGHYEGIVHNRIVSPKGESVKTDIILYHYGYALSDDVMERKFNRTFNLLKKQLEDNPADLYALYNMATLFVRRDPQKAVDYGLKLLSLLEEKGDAPIFYLNIFYILGSSFANLKQFDQSIDICLKVVNLFPKYVDAYWILCEVFFEKQDYLNVIRFGNDFLNYLTYYQEHSSELVDLFVYSYDQKDKIRLRLGLSYIYEGDWSQAAHHLTGYIKKHPHPSEALSLVLGHLNSYHPHPEKIVQKAKSLFSNSRTNHQENVSRPSLSLCMMVKNEEANLPRCLESVKGCVDEMIIVDTGSTDRTMEIARNFGAKVYQHPWENDFSKHRNQSLGYASGDWILWMDADEELEPGGCEEIEKAIRETSSDAISLTMVSYFDNRTKEAWNQSKKIFKNHLGIHFEGIVHNQVRGNKSNNYYPVKIYHYGYDLDPQAKNKKYERTSTLLKKLIEKEPNELRHRNDLAVCYQSMGAYQSALQEASNAIALSATQGHTQTSVLLWVYFVAASCSFNLDDLDEAERFALEAIDIHQAHLDSYFILSLVYHNRDDREKFEWSFQRYLQTLEGLRNCRNDTTSMVYNTIGDEWQVHLAHSDLCLATEDEAGSMGSLITALNKSPNRAECLRLMGVYCRKRGLWEKANQYFERAHKEGLKDARLAFENALTYRDKGELTKYAEAISQLESDHINDPEILLEIGNCCLGQGQFSKASEYLKRVSDLGFENPSVYSNLGLIHVRLGKTDDALNYYGNALELNPHLPEALINMGHLCYDLKRYDEAQSNYFEALNYQPNAVDVYIRIGLIALSKRDVESCVEVARLILNTLQIHLDRSLDSLDDLASVYRSIGNTLKDRGNLLLYQESLEMASGLLQFAPSPSNRNATHA